MSAKLKFYITAGLFAIGSLLILSTYTSGVSIPGIILVVLTGPPSYYYYAKMNSKVKEYSDDEILAQAKNESRLSRK